MSATDDESKIKLVRSCGSDAVFCSLSFSSEMPETDQLHAQRENVHSAYFLMRTHAEKLERERNRWKRLAQRMATDIRREMASDEACGNTFNEDLAEALMAYETLSENAKDLARKPAPSDSDS